MIKKLAPLLKILFWGEHLERIFVCRSTSICPNVGWLSYWRKRTVGINKSLSSPLINIYAVRLQNISSYLSHLGSTPLMSCIYPLSDWCSQTCMEWRLAIQSDGSETNGSYQSWANWCGALVRGILPVSSITPWSWSGSWSHPSASPHIFVLRHITLIQIR